MPPDNHSRSTLLNAPPGFLDLPPETDEVLAGMGFTTVAQVFRAAITGRLRGRKKGGPAFQDEVLAACCRLLGHPPMKRGDIAAFAPRPDERTMADGLARLSGPVCAPEPERLACSVRDLLLPGSLHQGITGAGISTVGDLYGMEMDKVATIPGIGRRNLGQLFIHMFDFLFLHAPPGSGGNGAAVHARPRPRGHDAPARMVLPGGGEGIEPDAVIIHRNLAGGLFGKGETVISLDRSGGAALAVFRHCSLCPLQSTKDDLCPHAAALAASIMTEDREGRPAPLTAVMETELMTLALQILFEIFGPGEEGCTREEEKAHGKVLLEATGPGGAVLAAWTLGRDDARVCRSVFPGRFRTASKNSDADRLAALHRRLTGLGRTVSEVSINEMGQKSSAQTRDGSVWALLLSRLAPAAAAGEFHISNPDENGLCRLALDHGGDTVFSLTLPRARTGDVLDALERNGFHRNILPRAQAVIRMVPDRKNGDAAISLLLRLDDGEEFDLHGLEDRMFGRFCHISGRGFVTFERAGLPEIAAGAIPHDEVPEFVRSHPEVIRDEKNDIAAEFRDMEVVSAPDSIELDGVDMDDDWCYISGRYGLGNRSFPITALLRAKREKKRYLNWGGKWLDLADGRFDWLLRLGDERVWNDDQGREGIKLSMAELFILKAQFPGLTSSGADIDAILDTSAWQEDDSDLAIPDHLRDYQARGVAWLARICRHRLGGILADDMGLGKTHQALALMANLMDYDGLFLVVCPATVVSHWLEKTRRFFPGIVPFVYHGSRRNIKKRGHANLILTTYGIIRRDADVLAKEEFRLIVFDEIQQLKNRHTEAWKAAVRLKGRTVIGLTGTPLENSVNDLKAVFDLCLPGYLGDDRWFNNRFAAPIAEGDRERQEELARMINPFILRRSREQVLTELPDVIEDIRTCELSDDQVGLYREIVERRGRPLLDRIESGSDAALPYMELLAVINYLKQICDHPCLLDGCRDPERMKSGKWDLFVELLGECLDARMKVVVFSHYTRMLDLIEAHLEKEGIGFCGLRGEMSLKTRQEMIHRFNNDPGCRVFSASLLAGGVGVDLTAAQAVIHYDRWWNAAREDQATARVHRMGQKKVVQVFKLITVGTLEEKINRLINRKRELARTIIQEDDAAVIKKLDRDEIISLLAPLNKT